MRKDLERGRAQGDCESGLGENGRPIPSRISHHRHSLDRGDQHTSCTMGPWAKSNPLDLIQDSLVSSKQTYKNFRFEPKQKQTEARSVSVVFRFVSWNQKPKISVCFGVSNLYRNNRNKQICFVTNWNNPGSVKTQNIVFKYEWWILNHAYRYLILKADRLSWISIQRFITCAYVIKNKTFWIWPNYPGFRTKS